MNTIFLVLIDIMFDVLFVFFFYYILGVLFFIVCYAYLWHPVN